MSQIEGPGQAGTELESGVLSMTEVVAQSVASVSPTAVIGALLVFVFEISGAGSWLIWLIATVVMVLTGVAISYLSRRVNATGGLYSLTAKAAHPAAGYVLIWAAAIAYLVGSTGVMFQGVTFVENFLALPAFNAHVGTVVAALIGLVFIGVPATFNYLGVKLSTRVMLVAEGVSITLIVILMIVLVAKGTAHLNDSTQLHLKGLTFHDVLMGGALTIFAFGGFESSTVFGKEAKNPGRMIPTAVIGSVLISGVLFAVCSYVLYSVVDHPGSGLANSADPLFDSARVAGMSWLGYVVSIGVIISVMSILIGIYASGSRFVMTLSKDGILPHRMASVSRRMTPFWGIVVLLIFNGVPLLVVTLGGLNVGNAFGDFANFGGWGTAVMYIVTCIAVFFVAIVKRSKLGVIVASVLAAAAMIYGFYTNYHPFPEFPESVWLTIFSIVMGVALVSCVLLLVLKPSALRRVGSSARGAEETSAPIGGTTVSEPSALGSA